VLLWESMTQRLLSLSAYTRLGTETQSGITVALARKADATLAILPPSQQAIARRIFLRLRIRASSSLSAPCVARPTIRARLTAP